ncbi:MAG: Uma2 family endonuclease [Actinocrinis sp.]
MSDEYTERPMAAEPLWDINTAMHERAASTFTQNLTVEQWEAMPEDLCRVIEVLDGSIVFMQSPTEDHQGASLSIAYALRRDARAYATSNGLCLATTQDYDLRMAAVPLYQRRPDVIVYRCIKQGERPGPQDTLLVVEIVSPSSRVIDKIDKLSEYAAAGVPHYWVVETRNGAISAVTWYALPPNDKRYEIHACWTPAGTPEGIRADEPFPVRISWDELAF